MVDALIELPVFVVVVLSELEIFVLVLLRRGRDSSMFGRDSMEPL